MHSLVRPLLSEKGTTTFPSISTSLPPSAVKYARTYTRMYCFQEQAILARGKPLPVKHVLARASDAKPKWWRSATANQARENDWEIVRLQHVANFLEEELAADIARTAAIAKVAAAKEAADRRATDVTDKANAASNSVDGKAPRANIKDIRLAIAQAKLKTAEAKLKTLETLRALQKDVLELPEMGGDSGMKRKVIRS